MADEEAEESDYADIDSCEREAEQEHRKCDQAEVEAEASGESDLYVSAEEVRRMKRKQQRQSEFDGKWNDSAMHEIGQQVALKRTEHVPPSPSQSRVKLLTSPLSAREIHAPRHSPADSSGIVDIPVPLLSVL